MKAIRIYTNKNLVPKEKIFVQSNDLYFNNRDISFTDDISEIDNDTSYKEASLSSIEKYFMKKIDNAVLLREDGDRIETPFGDAYLTDLSTGCKTVLNIVNPKENPDNIVFSLDECSSNVVKMIIEWVAENRPNQELYLTTLEVENCDDIEFIVDNDKHFTDQYEFIGYLCEAKAKNRDGGR